MARRPCRGAVSEARACLGALATGCTRSSAPISSACTPAARSRSATSTRSAATWTSRPAVEAVLLTRGPAEIGAVLRHESLPCPARGLELVSIRSQPVVATPEPGYELDLNRGVRCRSGSRSIRPTPGRHWYVIDRAIIREHGLALDGRPRAGCSGDPAGDGAASAARVGPLARGAVELARGRRRPQRLQSMELRRRRDVVVEGRRRRLGSGAAHGRRRASSRMPWRRGRAASLSAGARWSPSCACRARVRGSSRRARSSLRSRARRRGCRRRRCRRPGPGRGSATGSRGRARGGRPTRDRAGSVLRSYG